MVGRQKEALFSKKSFNLKLMTAVYHTVSDRSARVFRAKVRRIIDLHCGNYVGDVETQTVSDGMGSDEKIVGFELKWPRTAFLARAAEFEWFARCGFRPGNIRHRSA